MAKKNITYCIHFVSHSIAQSKALPHFQNTRICSKQARTLHGEDVEWCAEVFREEGSQRGKKPCAVYDGTAYQETHLGRPLVFNTRSESRVGPVLRLWKWNERLPTVRAKLQSKSTQTYAPGAHLCQPWKGQRRRKVPRKAPVKPWMDVRMCYCAWEGCLAIGRGGTNGWDTAHVECIFPWWRIVLVFWCEAMLQNRHCWRAKILTAESNVSMINKILCCIHIPETIFLLMQDHNTFIFWLLMVCPKTLK